MFGYESILTAAFHGFRPEVSFHTPIYLAHGKKVVRFVNATWRRRPDGYDIRCCSQIPKYVRTRVKDGRNVIVFRCQEVGHPGLRNFEVTPKEEEEGVRRIMGQPGDSNRFIVEEVDTCP